MGNPMTKEQFNKKWPMSKIPEAIREVAVAWGDAHHWFIEDKVKLAQDILEATDKLLLKTVKQQSIAFNEWLSDYGWERCDLNGPHSGKWVSDINIQYGFKTISQLYKEFFNTLTPKP